MTNPVYSDAWLTIFGGDCRQVLTELPAASVDCVVTSPPYWGLRDYGTAEWVGGSDGCDHVIQVKPRTSRPNPSGSGIGASGYEAQNPVYRSSCGLCGAVRDDAQLGLEESPGAYVSDLVHIFREVWRVLKPHGTVWLNLGDSYAGSSMQGGSKESSTLVGTHHTERPGARFDSVRLAPGLKAKDLVGIPWRVAFALQADGWYLRSDVVWAKPNPMPESVTDRPTKAHEYVFLLTKAARYYYDQEAVREAVTESSQTRYAYAFAATGYHEGNSDPKGGGFRGAGFTTIKAGQIPDGRNMRSVWQIATASYPGAHFAVFPPELPNRCIQAGSSEHGCCSLCGAPWVRMIELVGGQTTGRTQAQADAADAKGITHARYPVTGKVDDVRADHRTLGWQPTCEHGAEPTPAIVLDPFAGSGTVGMVANHLSRRAILIDLNPEYLTQQLKRNAQIPLGV